MVGVQAVKKVCAPLSADNWGCIDEKKRDTEINCAGHLTKVQVKSSAIGYKLAATPPRNTSTDRNGEDADRKSVPQQNSPGEEGWAIELRAASDDLISIY